MNLQAMNRRPDSGTRAFTLIELLTVIAIIAILAAITIGVMSFAQSKAAEQRTRAVIALVESGLEKYKDEHGEYPRPHDNTGDGVAGAIALYQALNDDGGDAFEGGDGSGSNGKAGDGRIIDLVSEGFVGSNGRDRFVQDGWGQALHYRVFDRRRGDNPNDFYQRTYDLWSYGTDEEQNESNKEKWIGNW